MAEYEEELNEEHSYPRYDDVAGEAWCFATICSVAPAPAYPPTRTGPLGCRNRGSQWAHGGRSPVPTPVQNRFSALSLEHSDGDVAGEAWCFATI